MPRLRRVPMSTAERRPWASLRAMSSAEYGKNVVTTG